MKKKNILVRKVRSKVVVESKHFLTVKKTFEKTLIVLSKIKTKYQPITLELPKKT